MADELTEARTQPRTAKVWQKYEKDLYADATVRVLGSTDVNGRMLCEFTSGPLEGCFVWLSSAELVKEEPPCP